MKWKLRQITTVAAVCSAAALLSACGGSKGSSSGDSGTGLYTGKTSQATIDQQSVKDALTGIKDIMPSCTATGVAKPTADEQASSLLSVIKMAQRMLPPDTAKKVGKSVALLATTAPTSKNGDCGGVLSYPTYSHVSGTTTMSVKWDNYCTLNSTTGNKTTYNGTLSAVDAGTPGPSGPVTTKLTADIPGLTIVEKTSTGTVVSNETMVLSNFAYVPATGATADVSNVPGTMSFSAFEAKDLKTNKDYKFENMNIVTSKVGTSDTQISMSGRVYRGATGYSDLTTDTPLVMDSSQNLKSGKISFTGASGHKATYTAVSGAGQKFTVAVDSTPITGVQLNCSGL